MKSEYDTFAENFSQSRQDSWPEFEIFLPFIHPHDRILDLGCGNGRLRKFLTPSYLRLGNYYGLDISQKLLNIARQEYPHDHFFHGDFSQKLVFGSDTFDMVIAIASFHHLLSKKDQLFFLEECQRILKKDGILFFTTWKLPTQYFWSNILNGRWKNWIIPFGHQKLPRTYRRTSPTELQRLLKKSGFEVLKFELFRERNYCILAKNRKKK